MKLASEACKTFIRRLDSDRRLFSINKLQAACGLPFLFCVPVVCQFPN